jgi:hypothetical protein
LIPAGTGYFKHRNVKLIPLVEPVEEKEEKPVEEVVQAVS